MVKKFYIIGKKKQKVDGRYFCDIVKKYNNSPKGRKTREEYVKKNREKINKYNREYCAKRKKEAKKAGLCTNCYKRATRTGYSTCDFCLKRARMIYNAVVK